MSWVYTSFVFIGIASFFFIQIIFFVPLIWVSMSFFLLTLNWRSFFASILGLLTPYWLSLGVFFFSDATDKMLDHITSIAYFQPLPDYWNYDIHHYVAFGFILLLMIIGIIHFTRNSYLDKIRTRMFFNTFILMSTACVALIVLQPIHFYPLMGILIVNVSPLIAHYITLTHTRLTNISFFIIIAISISIIAFNLWSRLLTFL